MKIVESYLDEGSSAISPELLTERYLYTDQRCNSVPLGIKQFIDKKIRNDSVILFSGSWRFDYDVKYFESKYFKNCQLPFHKNTFFVESNRFFESKILNLALKKIKPTSILIIHSDFFSQHLEVSLLIKKIDFYKQFLSSNGEILFTLPLKYLNFNRLTTSLNTLITNTNGVVVDDCIVITRKN